MSLKNNVLKMYYGCCRHLPVKKQKVLLFSYYGEQYSGSPKYIGKYLSGNTSLKIVWAFTDPHKHDDVVGKKVRYGRFRYLYHLATAGTVITNYRMTTEFKKRIGQKYIQTWHSSLRLKMIEKDAEETLPTHYLEMAKLDSKQIDYLLAGSGKSKEIFEHSFWYEGPIIESGTPQCDILFADNLEIKKKVHGFFGLPDGAKIALYAPTFRKNHDTSVYNLDTKRLISSLHNRFGGEWYLLMRLHPHLVNNANCFTYTDNILPATSYDDVQELLAVSDILISDYSAIMFDYLVTRRPCFLYTPDLEDYIKNDRKLYFNVKQLPFQVCLTNDELRNGINNYLETQYDDRVHQFISEINSYDDGNACKRVADLIKENL